MEERKRRLWSAIIANTKVKVSLSIWGFVQCFSFKIKDNSFELEVHLHFHFFFSLLIIVICLEWWKRILSDSIICLPFLISFFISSCRVGETGAWDEIERIHTNGSRTTYVVTNLLPFTVYSFRIVAVNRLGMSHPSKESYYICTLREGEPKTFERSDKRRIIINLMYTSVRFMLLWSFGIICQTLLDGKINI